MRTIEPIGFSSADELPRLQRILPKVAITLRVRTAEAECRNRWYDGRPRPSGFRDGRGRPTTHGASAAVHEAEPRVIAVPGKAWDRGSNFRIRFGGALHAQRRRTEKSCFSPPPELASVERCLTATDISRPPVPLSICPHRRFAAVRTDRKSVFLEVAW